MNIVILHGTVNSNPTLRDFPSGVRSLNLEVTTVADGDSTSVPVAWYDPPAFDLRHGDEVTVVGTVRRRFFRSGGSTQARTEVVASIVTADFDAAATAVIAAVAEVGRLA